MQTTKILLAAAMAIFTLTVSSTTAAEPVETPKECTCDNKCPKCDECSGCLCTDCDCEACSKCTCEAGIKTTCDKCGDNCTCEKCDCEKAGECKKCKCPKEQDAKSS